jgi:hypothetical protein
MRRPSTSRCSSLPMPSTVSADAHACSAGVMRGRDRAPGFGFGFAFVAAFVTAFVTARR